MGVVNFGINRDLVNILVQKYKIPNFIETGTYLGETSVWASGIFNQVHTIEISKSIYDKTTNKYKHIDNIVFHLGDSKDILPKITPILKGSALFWLDGHWCGRDTGGKFNICPIMDELNEAIKVENPIILIDDIRYFLGPNPFDYGENYPSLHSIILYLSERLPNHYITIHDDTLLCLPYMYKSVVDDNWKSTYNKRYPSSFNSILSKIWWRIKNFDFTLEKNRNN